MLLSETQRDDLHPAHSMPPCVLALDLQTVVADRDDAIHPVFLCLRLLLACCDLKPDRRTHAPQRDDLYPVHSLPPRVLDP